MFMLRTIEGMSNSFIPVNEPYLPLGSFPDDDEFETDDVMMTAPEMEAQINPIVTAINSNFRLMSHQYSSVPQHSNHLESFQPPLPFNPLHPLPLPSVRTVNIVLTPYGGHHHHAEPI
jgi:hypothetical protein